MTSEVEKRGAESIGVRRGDGGWVVPLLGAVLFAAFVAGPIVLHFAQKVHNHLPPPQERIGADEAVVPGEVYAGTLAAVVQHELDGHTGWRPNDFFLWGPSLWADNNANRQLGIIQAVRESMRVFKDHLTKVSSDQYDPNLVAAENALRNDEKKLWLPSAESKLREGVAKLNAYILGLRAEPRTSRPISGRNVELIRLFQAWTDLLGGAHAKLYDEDASWLLTDDYFYQAQGVAHVLHQMLLAVHREYTAEIDTRPALGQLTLEAAAALQRAALLKPLVVLNGSPDGLLANHRRNLGAFINEARQKMYSIREELEK